MNENKQRQLRLKLLRLTHMQPQCPKDHKHMPWPTWSALSLHVPSQSHTHCAITHKHMPWPKWSALSLHVPSQSHTHCHCMFLHSHTHTFCNHSDSSLPTCVNYAKINNLMLCMNGHISSGFFCCDILFLQGKDNRFCHTVESARSNFLNK